MKAGRPIKLTEEERAEMYRLWKIEHKAINELAIRFGVSSRHANETITKQDEKSLTEVRLKRKLVDEQLEKIMKIKCNTGIDSTVDELLEARKQEKACVDRIKKIDPAYFVTIKADYED